MQPVVAIVGRPNVGKSTLFNRLAGQSLAIVHDTPGVTRDRHYAPADLLGREILLVDTGGFDPGSDDPMGQGIATQVRIAIEEADAVVCVLDGTQPPLDADRNAVKLLRQSEKPVLFVANKVDHRERELAMVDLYALGVDRLFPISALHGRGTGELGAALSEALPKADASAPVAQDSTPRIALIGRPNAGKSSLLNRLCGEQRALVDDRPGTTRDPVDSEIEFDGRRFIVVDTAGIRRRTHVDQGVEAVSVLRSIRAMSRAQLALVVCDATEGVTDQDLRLLSLCEGRGRAVLVALNKVDLLSAKERSRALENASDAVRFARWVPILPISAKTGRGVRELMRATASASDEYLRRVPTAELNRFFEQVLERRTPPTHGGRAPRIYYITQAQAAPPVFVAISNAPQNIAQSYQRFVTNEIRKHFGFAAIPLRVEYRPKRKS
jgi:GTP-binding protein